MQLKTDGEIKDIEEGRGICRASSEVHEYSPENTSIWDEVYDRYLELSAK
jgi:hypothetical protein